ncbi:DUF3306 domain-containing protein [Methylobacterium sp. P31]
MSERFLARWTRRKLAVRAAALADHDAPTAPDDAPVPAPDKSAAEAARIEPRTGLEAEPPEPGRVDDPALDLPSLDALTHESDLAQFLQAGVPTALRNAALRRMWSLDPAIRDFVSEAREYAYDWNTPGSVPGLGPLLPSDDVKAMLGRLLGGASKAETVSGETRDDRSEGPREPSPAPEPLRATDPAPPPADLPEHAPALPGPGETVPIQQAAQAASGPEPALEALRAVRGERTDLRPRLRRHGGAAPPGTRRFGLRGLRTLLIIVLDSGIGTISNK